MLRVLEELTQYLNSTCVQLKLVGEKRVKLY